MGLSLGESEESVMEEAAPASSSRSGWVLDELVLVAILKGSLHNYSPPAGAGQW